MSKIHPSAVVENDTHLDDDVVVGAHCYINSGAVLGSGCVLEANVIIEKNVKIGKNNHFFQNAVIGAWPQVMKLENNGAVGGLVIGDNNSFHENVTIHPSIYEGELTVIGNNNFIMIGAHIGHDCVLEDQIVLSNLVQISGHSRIETGVWLSGVVLSHQFVTVGKWSYAAGLAGLNKDIPPYMIISGHYPPEVRGVNKRGMTRAGLSDDQQSAVYHAYKRLYRKGGNLVDNAVAMLNEADIVDCVKDVVDSIIHSSEHRYGRYLEKFRH